MELTRPGCQPSGQPGPWACDACGGRVRREKPACGPGPPRPCWPSGIGSASGQRHPVDPHRRRIGATPPPQDEETPFYPRSPYGAAKLYSYWMTRNYREAYDMFAVNGILFNHESPRRGETFVTRKIARAAARIKLGLEESVYMGNLDAARDWGYAPEYVEGMWRMLQADEPSDYVLATGTSYTVRNFVELCFEHVGLNWEDHVKFDPRYMRPTEVDSLIGDQRACCLPSWRRSWSTPSSPTPSLPATRTGCAS